MGVCVYEGEGGRGMDEKLGVSKLDEGSFENRKKNRGNHSVTYGHVFEVLLINLLHVGGGRVSCVI